MAKVYDGACPCKDCENKGCGTFHSKCDKYNSWRSTGVEEERKPYLNTLRYKRRNTKVWKRWGLDK